MSKQLLIILIFLLGASSVHPQNFQQKFAGIDFIINGQASDVPFNGGINSARVQFVDINGDGRQDLFAFDVDTTLNYYQNTGSSSVPKFQLISTRYQNISFRNWYRFIDIDNDGDFDLFTGGESQTVKFYRNTGGPVNAAFNLEIPELRTNTDTTILSESNCIPTFCDMDNDGDLDFFSGTSTLGQITLYENIGTASNFSFKFITDFWQNIQIISPARPPRLNLNEIDERHGANSLEFGDVDGDGDNDLFFGDLFSKGIYFIKNNGTPVNPNMAIVDSSYPHNESFISLGYNSVRLADIDGDGDKDFFVTVLLGSQTAHNFAFYRNNGSNTSPLFQRVTDNFMTNVDAGDWSYDTFTDLDNDGKQDLLIGGGTNGLSGSPKIQYYRNTGTLTSPQFTLMQDSLPIQITNFNFRFAPAFADIDNDGDKDMILGSFILDSIFFYRNIGTPGNYNFVLEARGNQIGITGTGQYNTPTFVDIDNDGDQDLFVGNSNGKIHFYENTGTASSFNFVFRTNSYLNIDIGNESVPRFYDIDRDGDMDLFIGRIDGKISYYRNDGNASVPNFVFQTDDYGGIRVSANSCPTFVDIDNDTDGDLFLGNVKGGIYYYENRDIVGIHNISQTIPEAFELYQNYPNPFNPSTKIKFDVPSIVNGESSTVNLKVYDVSGKEIAVLVSQQLQPGTYEYEFDASDLSSGIYFYTLTFQNISKTNKMLLLK